MKDSQLKPIQDEELPEIKEKVKEENTSENNKEIIKSLPSWSIEPPIEIKRG